MTSPNTKDVFIFFFICSYMKVAMIWDEAEIP